MRVERDAMHNQRRRALTASILHEIDCADSQPTGLEAQYVQMQACAAAGSTTASGEI